MDSTQIQNLLIKFSDNLLSEQIINWLLLLVAIISSYMALITFIKNYQQRKLENTHRLIDFLREHIKDSQINRFIELFQANNPITTPLYEFHFPDGKIDYVENMFSEGGCGYGDIHNMIGLFNLISPQLIKDQVNIDLIWYEYGQMMDKFYEWTEYLEKKYKKPNSQFLEKYSDEDLFFAFTFNRFMENKRDRLIFKPIKHYTYLE